MRAISTLQTFQSLHHYLELQQSMVFELEAKKQLIRRNSRLNLKCFDFKVHINAGNTWEKSSLLVTARELVCFKQPFGNFEGKYLLESCVSVKFQVMRRTELEKSTCQRLYQKLRVSEGLFLVKLPFYVSYKALILILLSNE